MTKILSIIFASVLTINLAAQKATYVGLSAGSCNDVNEFADPGPYLYRARCLSSSFGLIVRQEINKNFSLETGLFSKHYTVGFGAKLNNSSIENNSQSAYTLQVPIRLNSRINLYKDKISILTTLGPMIVFNLENGGGDSSTFRDPTKGVPGPGFRSNSDSIFFYVARQKSSEKIIPLIQTGITLELKLFKRLLVDIYFSYYTGFKHFEDCTVVYNINNSGTLKTKMFLNGSYSNIGISLCYPISTFWDKKVQADKR